MSKSPFALEQAAGLASLPDDDPQRVAAYEQAQNDPEFLHALREGEQLISLLGQVPVAPPTPEALDRAARAVLSEMDAAATAQLRAPATSPGWQLLVLPLSVVAAWAAVLALTNGQSMTSDSRMLSSALLVAAAAAAAIGIARLGGLLVAAAAVVGSLVFAAAASTTGGLGSIGEGLHCTLVTLLSAALPLTASVGLAHRGGLREAGGALAYGAVAATGALAGVAALHLTCGGAMIGHLLLFHAGGVLLATLAGFAVGSILTPQRG